MTIGAVVGHKLRLGNCFKFENGADLKSSNDSLSFNRCLVPKQNRGAGLYCTTALGHITPIRETVATATHVPGDPAGLGGGSVSSLFGRRPGVIQKDVRLFVAGSPEVEVQAALERDCAAVLQLGFAGPTHPLRHHRLAALPGRLIWAQAYEHRHPQGA